MICGHPPFVDRLYVELAKKHADEIPIAPSKFVPAVPSRFDTAVMRLLAKSPDNRPQSVEELLRILCSPASVAHVDGWARVTKPVESKQSRNLDPPIAPRWSVRATTTLSSMATQVRGVVTTRSRNWRSLLVSIMAAIALTGSGIMMPLLYGQCGPGELEVDAGPEGPNPTTPDGGTPSIDAFLVDASVDASDVSEVDGSIDPPPPPPRRPDAGLPEPEPPPDPCPAELSSTVADRKRAKRLYKRAECLNEVHRTDAALDAIEKAIGLCRRQEYLEFQCRLQTANGLPSNDGCDMAQRMKELKLRGCR